jgi:succinate---hydroxymethylglutarate CoA-transferase
MVRSSESQVANMANLGMSIVIARGMIKELDHPALGKLKVLNSPVQYSRSGPSIRTPPPLLGQHTKQVLRDVLGFGDAEVDSLKKENVIHVDDST